MDKSIRRSRKGRNVDPIGERTFPLKKKRFKLLDSHSSREPNVTVPSSYRSASSFLTSGKARRVTNWSSSSPEIKLMSSKHFFFAD